MASRNCQLRGVMLSRTIRVLSARMYESYTLLPFLIVYNRLIFITTLVKLNHAAVQPLFSFSNLFYSNIPIAISYYKC